MGLPMPGEPPKPLCSPQSRAWLSPRYKHQATLVHQELFYPKSVDFNPFSKELATVAEKIPG